MKNRLPGLVRFDACLGTYFNIFESTFNIPATFLSKAELVKTKKKKTRLFQIAERSNRTK